MNILRRAATLCVLLLAACSGGGDAAPVTPPATPTISLALATTAGTVIRGSNAAVAVSLTRGGGYTGAVLLAAAGAPAGVQVSFEPPSLSGSATTSVATFAVGATAAPGTATITITASGSGVTAATTTYTLTIPTPGIGVTAAPTVSVTQGTSGNVGITLARNNGYADAIVLTTSGAPASVTATFAPATVPAGVTASTLAFAVSGTAAPGSYPITITAAGTGVTSATTTVTLTVTAAATPAFGLSAAPAALTVTAGQGATSTITVARSGGFAGDVAAAVSGAPAGMSAVLAPTAIASNSATSTLTVTTTAAVAPGNYTLTVSGTGTGVTAQSTTVAVTVNAAPGYSLSATAVALTQGGTGTSTVTIARTGNFAGAIALAVTGLPNGVTAVVNPGSTTGTSATITLTAASNAATGNFSATVTGTAAGLANVTTSLAGTVSQQSGGGGNVNWTFCETARFPLWFAVQNGTGGAWTRVTPTGSNTRVYSFSVASVGGVAYAIAREGGGTDVTVQYLSLAEFTAAATNECVTNRPTKSLTGSVANVPAGASAFIGSGGATATVNGPATTFSLTGVDDGLTDVAGIRTALNLTTFSLVPDRGILRRNVNYAAGSAIPVLDMTGAESFAVASADYTITNAGTDQVVTSASLITPNGFAATFSFPTASGLGATQKVFGVPSSITANGDLHQVLITAFSGSGVTTSSRILALYNRDLVNRSVTLGATLPAPTIASLGTSPYVRLSASGPWQADYGDAIGVGFTQQVANSNSWTLSMSRSYAGAGTSWTLAVPDFSSVSGFNSAWALAGGATNWAVSATGGLVGLAGAGVTGFTENGSFRVGARTGTISP